jgi:lipid II:glycine glycyltransferase (peptidoglycan interpeptide bridge formation enzyme)
MAVTIKMIGSESQWREAEALFKPHTFLQSWEWGVSQAALGQKIFRLGIFRGDAVIGLAFIYTVNTKLGLYVFCPHGPIIDWSKAEETLPALLEFIIRLSKGIKANFIRFSPLAENSPANQGIFRSLIFRPAPVHMMHPELAWMLDLKPDLDMILKGMEKRTRYSIRKAKKELPTSKAILINFIRYTGKLPSAKASCRIPRII